MGCNLRDLATAEDINLAELKGKRVGIDAFLTAFQFLTTIRDRSPTGDGGPLRDSKGRTVAHLMGISGLSRLLSWELVAFSGFFSGN